MYLIPSFKCGGIKLGGIRLEGQSVVCWDALNHSRTTYCLTPSMRAECIVHPLLPEEYSIMPQVLPHPNPFVYLPFFDRCEGCERGCSVKEVVNKMDEGVVHIVVKCPVTESWHRVVKPLRTINKNVDLEPAIRTFGKYEKPGVKQTRKGGSSRKRSTVGGINAKTLERVWIECGGNAEKFFAKVEEMRKEGSI